MSRMRSLITAATAVAALLAGCGGGDTAGSSPDSSVTLQFVLFGDAVETAGYQQLIDDFTADNPDVRIVLSPVATQDDLLAKLTTGFAGGSPPDVFLINYRRYGQFADQGVLEPVGPYLDDSDAIDESDFAETALEPFRFDGQTLTCMPQNISSLQVYYNVDLFEQSGAPLPEAGWTWDEFLAAAQAITGDGNYGLGIEPTLIRLAPFVWSAGGELVDDPKAPTRLTIDAGAAREALDFFLDLQLKHGVVPPQREELSQDSESRFLNGRLGMYLNSRRSVPTLRTIDGFTWDVAPLPVAPGGEPSTIQHGDAYCMSRDGRNIDATWRFIEYANTAEGQTTLAATGRTVPSRTDVAESPVFLEPEEPPASSQVFLDVIGDIRGTPVTATWPKVEKEANNILEGIFYGQTDQEEGIRQMIEETVPLFGSPDG
jgi:multiple sugar transport system substrate-binding protein